MVHQPFIWNAAGLYHLVILSRVLGLYDEWLYGISRLYRVLIGKLGKGRTKGSGKRRILSGHYRGLKCGSYGYSICREFLSLGYD